VLAGEAADGDAAARVRGRASCDDAEVTTRVVGDGEIARLSSNDVGNDV